MILYEYVYWQNRYALTFNMCKHLTFNIFYSFHDVTGNSVYLIFMYL